MELCGAEKACGRKSVKGGGITMFPAAFRQLNSLRETIVIQNLKIPIGRTLRALGENMLSFRGDWVQGCCQSGSEKPPHTPGDVTLREPPLCCGDSTSYTLSRYNPERWKNWIILILIILLRYS